MDGIKLEGSMLGTVLRDYSDVEVVPLLGLNFVEPWPIIVSE